jgi:hypothetical protein
MEMIDRYVYAVTEHLPQDTREDVSLELRANIEDMLPEDPTESDVRAVLEKLGNPAKLSNEYSQQKRYLIGPSMYDSYFSVLKLVIGIVAIVFTSLTLLDWVLTPPMYGNFAKMSTRFFIDILVAPIQGVLQGFLWVTLTFVVLERSGINEGKMPFVKKKWTPDDLPVIPVSKGRKISRGETIFSMFCTVFFTALLYFNPQLIGVYTKGHSGLTLLEPIFVVERLQSYMIIILIFAIIQLCIFIWKFIAMQWNYPLAIANASHNVALSILVCVMVSDTSLFNSELLLRISSFTETHLTEITSTWFRNSLWISVAVFVAISLWDSIMGFVKCKKLY